MGTISTVGYFYLVSGQWEEYRSTESHHMSALVKADEDSNIEIEEEINYDDIDKRKQEEQGQQL